MPASSSRSMRSSSTKATKVAKTTKTSVRLPRRQAGGKAGRPLERAIPHAHKPVSRSCWLVGAGSLSPCRAARGTAWHSVAPCLRVEETSQCAGVSRLCLGVGRWKLGVGSYRELSEIPLPSTQSYCLPVATFVNSSDRPLGQAIVTRSITSRLPTPKVTGSSD